MATSTQYLKYEQMNTSCIALEENDGGTNSILRIYFDEPSSKNYLIFCSYDKVFILVAYLGWVLISVRVHIGLAR